MQHNTDEYDQSNIMIVQKSLEAGGRLSGEGEPLVIDHKDGRTRHGTEIPNSKILHVTDEDQADQHENLHYADEK